MPPIRPTRGFSPTPPASLLTGLVCTACGVAAPEDACTPCAACGAALRCTYGLDALDPASFPAGPPSSGLGVFRWAALLPVRDAARRLTLGEGDTPCLALPRLAGELGASRLFVKDEGQNPGGSFKARGLAVALAAHAERGATAVTLPTAGNAGSAAAQYAVRHGLTCRVVLPTAASSTYRCEQRLLGARVIGVSGDLGAAGDWVKSHARPDGDHLLATFFEPFRVEGKKTLAFEIWEAFGEDLPDVVIHPTGGGTAVAALHAGFAQLRAAGLLDRAAPQIWAAQVDSCAPVVAAFRAGARTVEPWAETRRTLAEGLRVPRVAGAVPVLQALAESGGQAVQVAEPAALEAIRRAARSDGMLLSAEGGVALAAAIDPAQAATLRGASILVLNTAAIHKSPETLAAASTA